MKVRGKAHRVVWRFHERVPIPEGWRKWFWDHPEGTVPREKLILRVVQYGDYEAIHRVYRMDPDAFRDVVHRHRETIPRGVFFWLRVWDRARS